jgi:hypothetical protein
VADRRVRLGTATSTTRTIPTRPAGRGSAAGAGRDTEVGLHGAVAPARGAHLDRDAHPPPPLRLRGGRARAGQGARRPHAVRSPGRPSDATPTRHLSNRRASLAAPRGPPARACSGALVPGLRSLAERRGLLSRGSVRRRRPAGGT